MRPSSNNRAGSQQGSEVSPPAAPLAPVDPPEPASSGAPAPAGINLTVSADGLLLVLVAGWVVWSQLLRGWFVRRFQLLLSPPQESRYLLDLLAQIAVLTSATRVAVGSFHAGELSALGFAFTRVTIVSCYVAHGRLPLSSQARDLPISRISADVEDLLMHGLSSWRLVEAGPHLPAPCRDYLRRNQIACLYGRLVLLGQLPIGILNLQFEDAHLAPADLCATAWAQQLEELFEEVSQVLRSRRLRPPLWRRILALWS